jgi:hypothetical protein
MSFLIPRCLHLGKCHCLAVKIIPISRSSLNMKTLRFIPVLTVFMVMPTVWGVYAPIPEQEQGKGFTATLRAGLSHDSNIFGASSAAISSSVVTFAPSLKFYSSLTDQTFFPVRISSRWIIFRIARVTRHSTGMSLMSVWRILSARSPISI